MSTLPKVSPTIKKYSAPALSYALALALTLTACTPQSLFYQPNRTLYLDPAQLRLAYDTVSYPTTNGKTLYALSFQTRLKPKGTVVHFHGNYGNVSNHFPLSIFLLKQGYDLLVFDYQGYGASEGKATARGTVEDGIATLRYAHSHLRDKSTGVVVFGQSLGGAIAIVATAREPLAKAAVIEAAFTSYPAMGRVALRRSAWTWLSSFILPVFLSHRYNPIDYIAKIAPRPVLLIHGSRDRIVPVDMSKALFDQAREPKQLWVIEGAGHLNYAGQTKTYEQRVTDFFDAALASAAKNNAAH